MHAADVVETLPAAHPEDDVLSAVRMVCRQGLPGLAVVDEHGTVIGCMSSVDLLRLTVPGYLREDPILARVFDEERADRIAAALVGTCVRDVLGQITSRVPVARPEATVIELAEVMTRRGSPIAMIVSERGGTVGVVTANRLLGLLVDAAEDAL